MQTYLQTYVLNGGPLAEEGEEDIDLINAGGQFVKPVPGMCFFNSADGFAMIRGGHVDVTVLGAHQVSAKGDLANWMLPQRGVGNVGGAMDLAIGARSVIVAMEHTDRDNQPKIVEECTFPITGSATASSSATISTTTSSSRIVKPAELRARFMMCVSFFMVDPQQVLRRRI